MLPQLLSTTMLMTATIALMLSASTPLVRASKLEISRISVPRRVALGDSAKLECDWSNGGRKIYSLKWYFGLDEFYRWTPADPDPIQVFDVAAFKVVKSESSLGRVLLRDFTRLADGTMRCEISEEAPAFHTTSMSRKIEVVELPLEPPSLTLEHPSYQLHEQVALNCTSLQSKPPVTLSLSVNNEPVSHTWVSRNLTLLSHHMGFPLYTSVVELRFRLMPRHMDHNNRVPVKCIAQIEDVYWQVQETYITVDMPQRASIMEGRASAGCLHSEQAVVTGLLLSLLQHLLHLYN